ncbi:MAG: PAS domain S-box protein [Bryobacteraceae bacterium]|jgi:formate hydrogenlyase transcriptional activator
MERKDLGDARLQVARSEERWRSVFENSAIGVALTDLNGCFLATNPVYQEMVGYSEEELLGRSFLDITHEDHREANWALASELLEGKRQQFQVEKQYRRKDGSLIWVHNNISLVPGTETMPRCIMALSEDITERKNAEQALRDAEEFKSRLIACSQDCIKMLDLDGRLLWMNEGGMRALEICDVGPFVNTSWVRFWEGEDRKAAQAAVETARNGGTGRFTGYFATTATRQPRWWDVVVSPIRNAQGEPGSLLAVSRDVTEHERNEEALRDAHLQVARSEERWRSVFENSAIGVALTDLNGRFLATNPVYQKMVGYSEEELLALSFLDITHADYREINRALAAELLEGKREQFQIEKQYRRKDGALIWVRNNVSLVPGSETMPRFIMALSEDITVRKSAEEALRNSEERVRLILDSTAEGIFGCNPNGTCLFCNSAAVRLLGYDDTSELLGKNMHALEHHTRADGSPYPIEECPIYIGFQKGEGVHRDDEVYWRKDGTSFPVEFWSHPVFQEGRTLGAVITFVDITERKQVEEALRKSEQRKRSVLEINNAIITNLTEEALLSSISEALRPSIPFDRCAITLYQPERDTFRFMAVAGDLRSDYFQPGLEVRRAETTAGWVFDHQQPLRRNLEEERPFANEKRLWAEGLRSLCIVPLILRGKSIGTLSVVNRGKDPYTDEHAQFLQEVAVQVALAIGNMKSYEEIATLKALLEKENVYLREEIRTAHNFEEIVGNSPALLAVLRTVEQVAPTDSTVLIYGETGTGKELIARAIHNRSARKDRALVSVNCSAISAGLVESELFGHLKGAFTGAIERRIGRFELANGGTIFLDEIGELPLETQVKLLRVLQEHEFEPVGSSRTQRVDVRVIAATNRNLREEVEAGRFRSDLFFRLNVLPLQLPPLRERPSDIPQLVALCVSRFAKRFGKKVEGVSRETMARLMSYPWPGNVRELQNVMERAIVLSAGPTLRLDKDLVPLAASEGILETTAEAPAQENQPGTPSSSGLPTLEEVERSHILAALQQSDGVVDGPKGAARILNLHPNTLRHRMNKLGIKRSAHGRL